MLILLKCFKVQFLGWRIKYESLSLTKNFIFALSCRFQGIYSPFHLPTRESSPLILADNLLFLVPPSLKYLVFCNRLPPICRPIRSSKDFLCFRCYTKEKNSSTKQDGTCMPGCSNANQEFKRSHLFWFYFCPRQF